MKQKIKKWSPKRLTHKDILNIVLKYGADNDSLIDEKYEENIVQWEITIEIKRVKETP